MAPSSESNPTRLNTISLFSGIGGLDYGIKCALGSQIRTVCYVEREAYAAACLVARMEEAILDDAPIWDDVRTFDADAWRGKVDCIIGGFPCQPASAAGSRKGVNDDRWLWPDIIRIVDEVHPRVLFFENVPGLLSVNQGNAFLEILRTLAQRGYTTEWDCFSAEEVGAPHRRKRVFIMCILDDSDDEDGSVHAGWRGYFEAAPYAAWASTKMAHATRKSNGIDANGRRESAMRRSNLESGSGELGNANFSGLERRSNTRAERSHEWNPWPPGPEDDGLDAWAKRNPNLAPALRVESGLRGRTDGVRAGLGESHPLDYRTEQLHAYGNGVVPQTVALAFLTLAERLGLIRDV